MIAPHEMLQELTDRCKVKNAEYTKGDPSNVFGGFMGAQDFQQRATNTPISLTHATWNLESKHLANVCAFFLKEESDEKPTTPDFLSVLESFKDLAVYFAACAAMLETALNHKENKDAK